MLRKKPTLARCLTHQSKARILVVDDEDEIRRAVGPALAGRDYEVSEAYWQPDLEQSKARRAAAPAAERLKHVTAEIADLQRRIERQVANLEADDTTSALRRRIVARIAELEQHAEERRERARALAEEAADAPPTAADLGATLDRLPVIAERLPHLPQPKMRALFDSLHLQLAYQPAAQAVDVELTLLVDESPDLGGEVAEVWSVHLALHNTNPNPLVEGPTLVLASVHSKVRRAGYCAAGAR